MIRIKIQNVLIIEEISFKWLFFVTIAKSCIQNPTKNLMWSLFAKVVNNF